MRRTMIMTTMVIKTSINERLVSMLYCMKVGILGSGDVGRILGDGLIELGHMVKIGTCDPNKDEVVQWVSNHVGGEEER
jgi:hypothetical protein